MSNWFSADVPDMAPHQEAARRRASQITGSRGVQGAVPPEGFSRDQIRQIQALTSPNLSWLQKNPGQTAVANSPGGNGIGAPPPPGSQFAGGSENHPLAALLGGSMNANAAQQEAMQRRVAWNRARSQGLIPEGPGGYPEQGKSLNAFMRGNSSAPQ